jgi:type I restriction enzyme S subunit
MIPEGWRSGRFKEFAILQRGVDLVDAEIRPGPYPVVKSNGIDGWHDTYQAKAPGVTTGRSGTIGNAFYVEHDYWPHNTSLYVKDFRGNDPKFIYYLISSMNFERFAAGTSVPTLNRNDIHAIKVTAPDVPEQLRIANLLTLADMTISAAQASIAAAQKLKQALMQNLLTGKLKPDGTLRREEEFYVDPKFGRVPTGWSYRRIREISDSYAGATPSRSDDTHFQGGIPWVKSSELKGRFVDDTQEKISEAAFAASSTKWIPPNTVLFAMYGATAGDAAILRIKACTNQAVLALPPKDGVLLDHLYLYYALKWLVPTLIQITQGGGQPNLSKTIIDKSYICLPDDIEEQKEIALRLDAADRAIESRAGNLDRLGKLKKALMQNLLTGKIRIPAE